MSKKITGGQALIEALIANGAHTAFGVPGESYLAALDAFHDAVTHLNSLHAAMKQAPATWQKLTVNSLEHRVFVL